MEVEFLGTGSAWRVPEHSCKCAICTELAKLGEERTRTSFLVRGKETILVDCGPDIRDQMTRHNLQRPDAVLITHEHGDHYLGLDDLLAFRRSVPRDAWTPIPVYATKQTWEAIAVRFGYLIGSLIERREAVVGRPLAGPAMRITPFKTFHGATASGSVGYCMENSAGELPFKLVYTSDFSRMDDEPDFLMQPDLLVIQTHWLNEPRNNRPNHMSFQRAVDYIQRWNPTGATYLVHMSAGDVAPGDPCNSILKKLPPLSPMIEPGSGEPYPIPRCQAEWQQVIDRICRDLGLRGPVIVSEDGLVVRYPDR